MIRLRDALSNTLGAVHLLLKLNPCIVRHIVAADCIDQCLISCTLTPPSSLYLLSQLLQAILNPLRPWFILPLNKLALLILFLLQPNVVSITKLIEIWMKSIWTNWKPMKFNTNTFSGENQWNLIPIPSVGSPRSVCRCASHPSTSWWWHGGHGCICEGALYPSPPNLSRWLHQGQWSRSNSNIQNTTQTTN